MENIRTDHCTEESGIALVTTLVITVVIMMLIGGLTYLYVRGIGAVTINRQFSTVYEAASGAVEYIAGVIKDCADNPNCADKIGVVSSNFNSIVSCTNTSDTATIQMKTADGKFLITAELRCLGISALPGRGGVLRFPPPPTKGGLKGQATQYSYYSIVATAREEGRPENIGRTEVVYRLLQ